MPSTLIWRQGAAISRVNFSDEVKRELFRVTEERDIQKSRRVFRQSCQAGYKAVERVSLVQPPRSPWRSCIRFHRGDQRGHHVFLSETGSEAGGWMVRQLPSTATHDADRQEIGAITAPAAHSQSGAARILCTQQSISPQDSWLALI